MTDCIFKFFRLFLVEFIVPVAWPLVLAIVAFAYREQLADFFKRAIEIGPAAFTQNTPPLSTPITENYSAELNLPLPAPDPALADVERTILANLKQRGIDDLSNADQKNLFVREYAQLLIRSQFQFIGSQIFGTQIALLRRLDNSPAQSQAALTPIFDDHKKRVIEAGITIGVDFYGWISFMLNAKFVAVDSDGLYEIT
jgi:hypothetical protein